MSSAGLRLQSEPYAPTGNIGDSGFRKLLGTPSLDILQTVLREALQNSCDAAKMGKGPEVLIRIRRLTPDQLVAMQSRFLQELPAADESQKHIRDFLNSDSPRVLEICDFNTTGLGGPVRADRIPPDCKTTDFIDFLRNVGTSRDTMHGGGTYGFGKVSLYGASRCSTILVDSLAADASEDARRLMGCHLGPSHGEKLADGSVQRFTGRHWWGVPDTTDSFVNPMTGESATELSNALGFVKRSDEQTGTSVMILDPCLGEDDDTLVAGRILENVLYFFWPRMLHDNPADKKLVFRLEVNGSEIPTPSPDTFPPLDHFASALRTARGRSEGAQPIQCRRPAKLLGQAAIQQGLRNPRQRLVPSGESVFPDHCAHIAVMRPVELVVRYFEGTPFANEQLEWAGVFIVDDDEEVERAFAEAEPPAHDDWIPNILDQGSRARTFVNVGVREIRKLASEFAAPTSHPAAPTGGSTTLAAVSDVMGQLLGNNAEGGVSRKQSKSSNGRSQKPKVSQPEFIRLEASSSGPVAVFTTKVTTAGRRIKVGLQPMLVLDGSPYSSDETIAPNLISIMTDDGQTLMMDSGTVELSEQVQSLTARVAMPDDCAITLKAVVQGELD